VSEQVAIMVESKVCVGVVTGAHGIRGQVRVKSFTQEPRDIAAYGPLSDGDGRRRFELHIIGAVKGVLLARIDGVDDRDAAQALRGTEFFVPRDALPDPGSDEFYHADLIGVAAVLGDGTPYGKVLALHDFGAGDMIEIELVDGSVIVLAFTRIVVPEIDLAAGHIVVDPPHEIDARPEGGQ
jgi:16S rRNA processing protein RimM